MSGHAIRKRHGRLHVYDMETGLDVYSPPDFVVIHTREDLRSLVGMLDRGIDPAAAAASFEAAAPRRPLPPWPSGYRASRAGVPEGLLDHAPAV